MRRVPVLPVRVRDRHHPARDREQVDSFSGSAGVSRGAKNLSNMTRYDDLPIRFPAVPPSLVSVEGLPDGYSLRWASQAEMILLYGADEIVMRFRGVEYHGKRPDALRNSILLAAWNHEAERKRQAVRLADKEGMKG